MKKRLFSAKLQLGYVEAAKNLFLPPFSKPSSPCKNSLSLPCSSTFIFPTTTHEFHLGAYAAEGKRAITFPGLDVRRQWILLIHLSHWQCVIPAFESL